MSERIKEILENNERWLMETLQYLQRKFDNLEKEKGNKSKTQIDILEQIKIIRNILKGNSNEIKNITINKRNTDDFSKVYEGLKLRDVNTSH